jgi:pSer/pThr/pTyr-binding forkhead associated (FHA) protein
MLNASIQLLSFPPPSVDTERSRARCMMAGAKYPIGHEKLVVGRGDGVNCQVSDGHLSRIHFQIELKGDAAILSDIKSKHGTYLLRGHAEPRKVEVGENVRLESGDCIRAGRSTFRFEIENVPGNIDLTPVPPPKKVAPVASVEVKANPPRPEAPRKVEPTVKAREEAPDPGSFWGNLIDSGSISSEGVEKKEVGSRGSSGSHSISELWPSAEPVEQPPAAQPQNPFPAQSSPSAVVKDSSLFLWPTGTDAPAESEMAAPVVAMPVEEEAPATGETSAISVAIESATTGTGTHSRKQSNQASTGFDWYLQELGEMNLNQLLKTIQSLEDRVRFFAVVHFAKVGEYTPAALSGGDPVVQWLPPPIAFAYGPVIVKANLLERVLTPEMYQKLSAAQALGFCGSSDISLLHNNLVSRESSANNPNGSLPILSFLDQGFLLSMLKNIPLGQLVPALGSELCFLLPRKSEYGLEWELQSSANNLRVKW